MLSESHPLVRYGIFLNQSNTNKGLYGQRLRAFVSACAGFRMKAFYAENFCGQVFDPVWFHTISAVR